MGTTEEELGDAIDDLNWTLRRMISEIWAYSVIDFSDNEIRLDAIQSAMEREVQEQ